jgi:CMP-N-acetylneuraminic acid synthetase
LLVNVPCTAPLRAVEDVEACIAALQESGADICLTVKPADRSPYFTMVKVEDGWAHMLMTPPQPIHRRQDAPKAFDIVPVAEAARAEYVLETQGLLNGKVRAIIVPAERAFDIDTEMDFAFVEFMAERARAHADLLRS